METRPSRHGGRAGAGPGIFRFWNESSRLGLEEMDWHDAMNIDMIPRAAGRLESHVRGATLPLLNLRFWMLAGRASD